MWSNETKAQKAYLAICTNRKSLQFETNWQWIGNQCSGSLLMDVLHVIAVGMVSLNNYHDVLKKGLKMHARPCGYM